MQKVVDDDVVQLLHRAQRIGREACAAACGPGSASVKTGTPSTLLATRPGTDLANATRDALAPVDPDAEGTFDEAVHAAVPHAHVDVVRPDSVLALGTVADAAALVTSCFRGRIGWLPSSDPAAVGPAVAAAAATGLHGVVVAGRCLVTWGATSQECGDRTVEAVATARDFLTDGARPQPLGAIDPRRAPSEPALRRDTAVTLFPLLRGLASTTGHRVGHHDGSDDVLDALSRTECGRLVRVAAESGLLDVRLLFVDVDAGAGCDEVLGHLREAIDDDPPRAFLVPGVGIFALGRDEEDAARVAALCARALRVLRDAHGVSSYAPTGRPDPLTAPCTGPTGGSGGLTGRVALVTGGGSGIGREVALRLAAQGACVVVADLDGASAEKTVSELGRATQGVAVEADVRDEAAVAAAVDAAVLAFGGVDLLVNNAGLSISKPLVETTADDWDTQHDVMARGSFLVSRAAAVVMRAQGLPADIVYIVSKNAAFAGPNNVAYGATKANQAHQVRLLAAELGVHGIRVNGVSPDGVVQGSGIFANGWGRERARVYGVPVDELGAFYAQRTLLKLEVLPEHVADAVLALTGGLLSRTTGAILPVDGGVTGAFLR